jgi:hypothetical protein
MPLLPDTITGVLEWATDHIATWNNVVVNDLGDIGLTAADITALQGALTSAGNLRDASIAAHSAALAATVSQNDAIGTLRDQLSIAVSKIRVAAETNTNPNSVYALAEIPPRANPTPAPAPTPPTSLQGELTNDGYVTVAWTATRVNGDYWSVWRQLAGSSDLVLIGTTAGKTFTDSEVPVGVAWAQYRVRSHRGTEMSESSEPAQVVFGTAAAA